ncbi:MAG: ribosome biogenesis GTPase Der [Mycoplasmatales bacterium]
MKFRVAIVGRPNVGKSSLFNRIIKTKKSIVDDMPGVTRDRLYEKVLYNEKEFILIDTGGITLEDGDFNKEIKIQAEIAIDESELILFVVDGQVGVTAEDEMIVKLLKRTKKPILVCVNKVDNEKILNDSYEFYALGAEVIPLSAAHGAGIDDILEYIVKNYQLNEVETYDGISFSLIGRPNVGKSSLFNAMIGEEKSIVSNIEGTTRDTVDTFFEVDNQEYKMVDTAGIRKRGKIYEKIEKYSVLRALKVIEASDIILWLIDAEQGVIEQDKRVLGYAFEEKKPIIVIINKWDLINKETNTQAMFEKVLREKMPFIKDATMLFISAKNKKGIKNILPAIKTIYDKYTFEVSTSKVNSVLNEAVMRKVHPTHKGQPVRFYYGAQVGNKPPKFLIFVNNKKLVHFSYERYLKNYFKKSFGLEGISIEFIFKNRNEE